MQNLKHIARISYGIGIAGIGGLQFIFPWFRPVLLPIPAEATQNLTALVYLLGLGLVLAGLYVAFAKNVKTVALSLGFLFLLLFLFGHLPNRLSNNPGMLGAWTDALKLLALSGGALMIAHIFPGKYAAKPISTLAQITPLGKYFYALMLVLFGIDHFLYIDFVKTLVPAWIPGGNLFWTYFGGMALIGGGLAIFIQFRPRLISLLLGLMLFLWLVLLHIPRALVAPASDGGNEWTSVFQCLAFAGIAVLWPCLNQKDK